MTKINTTKMTEIVIAYGKNHFNWQSDDADHMVPDDADGVRNSLEDFAYNDFDEEYLQESDDWLLFCSIMMTEKVCDLIDWTYVRNEILKEFQTDEKKDEPEQKKVSECECGSKTDLKKVCVGGSYEGNAYETWCQKCLDDADNEIDDDAKCWYCNSRGCDTVENGKHYHIECK